MLFSYPKDFFTNCGAVRIDGAVFLFGSLFAKLCGGFDD